jgi:hypothetical protein
MCRVESSDFRTGDIAGFEGFCQRWRLDRFQREDRGVPLVGFGRTEVEGATRSIADGPGGRLEIDLQELVADGEAVLLWWESYFPGGVVLAAAGQVMTSQGIAATDMVSGALDRVARDTLRERMEHEASRAGIYRRPPVSGAVPVWFPDT